MNQESQTLDEFIADWTDTAEKTRAAFLRLKDFLGAQADVSLKFIPRPGVTYSLRAVHARQTEKPLFVMVDVIEDQPRWLSVCFYGEMIQDPEEHGDYVPAGLLGEDAVCFDLEAYDETMLAYLETRLKEAHGKAGQG